jgi:hypothetical protein
VQHPFTGVSAVGLDVAAVIDLCRAYEPLLRPGEAFSHTTAARLYGAPLPPRALAALPVHVTAPPGTSRARTRGVVGHEATMPVHLATRYGLPVVSPVTMWVQCAALVDRPDLVAIGDFLLTGVRHGDAAEPPLASIDELQEARRSFRGARGMTSIRWAAERIRAGVDSRPETLARLLLVGAGLPEPVIGPAVVVEGGRILHPDLGYPEHSVALEYEGAGHLAPVRWKRDIERRELLEDAGWRVIRATSDDLFDHPEALVRRVRRALLASSSRRAVDLGRSTAP